MLVRDLEENENLTNLLKVLRQLRAGQRQRARGQAVARHRGSDGGGKTRRLQTNRVLLQHLALGQLPVSLLLARLLRQEAGLALRQTK